MHLLAFRPKHMTVSSKELKVRAALWYIYSWFQAIKPGTHVHQLLPCVRLDGLLHPSNIYLPNSTIEWVLSCCFVCSSSNCINVEFHCCFQNLGQNFECLFNSFQNASLIVYSHKSSKTYYNSISNSQIKWKKLETTAAAAWIFMSHFAGTSDWRRIINRLRGSSHFFY